jgi:hypothetical protein
LMRAHRLTLATLTTLCALAAGLALAAPAALAGKTYFPGSVFGEPCTGTPCGDGEFSEPAGVAVSNATNDVYVVDKGDSRVEYFTANGTYTGQFNGSSTPAGAFSEPNAIAVDNSGKSTAEDPRTGDVYIGDSAHNVIDIFSATGVYKGQLPGRCETPGEAPPCTSSALTPYQGIGGISVDTQGNVWVLEYEGGRVDEYNNNGTYITSFEDGYGHGHAIMAQPDGSLLIARGELTGNVEVWTETAGSWSATLFAGQEVQATALASAPQVGGTLLDQASQIELRDSSGNLKQTFPGEGLTELHAIAASASGTAYATQRTADSVQIFDYAVVPAVSTQPASQLTETSETLNGLVNPEGEALTACRFEYAIYGTAPGVYPHSVPCRQSPAEIGDGTGGVSVSTEASGLQPGSNYNYRLAASNANGTEHSSAGTFAVAGSSGTASLSLPDGRAYELVSSIEDTEVFVPEVGEPESFEAEQDGELIAGLGTYRAAASGETIAYDGGTSPSGTGGYGVAKNFNGNLYLSTRGSSGWEEANIDPVPYGRWVEGFSPDLSLQLFNIGEPAFNAAHGGPAACTTSEGGELYSRAGGVAEATYQPLLPNADASPEECTYLTFAGTSADDTHVLIASPAAYTPQAVKGRPESPEAPIATREQEGFDNLYDSVAGQLHQVNILPDGQPEPEPYAAFGSRAYVTQTAAEHNFNGAVSSDGSSVVWTDFNTGALYVREHDVEPQSAVIGERCTEPERACTIQLDRAQPGAPGASGGGVFWAASSDGSRIIFTDCNQLTADSTATPAPECSRPSNNSQSFEPKNITGNDLYEYNLSSGTLTDLTVDRTDAGGADVQGVVATSEDDSYVYFIAAGALPGTDAEAHKCERAPAGSGEEAEESEGKLPTGSGCNLYLLHNGVSTLVATLAPADNQFVGTQSGPQNANAVAGDWQLEPGLHSAEAASGGAAVAFMSRLPLSGYDNLGCRDNNRKVLACPEVFVYQAASGRVVCASCASKGTRPVPTAEGWEEGYAGGGRVNDSGSSTFMSRWFNAEGTRLFFDSSQPLVPQDNNHRQDVYEWESDGSGGCPQAAGCVALISGGDSPHNAYFLDASESGGDVFFATREQLLKSASGEAMKLYDARVSGGFSEFSQACSGTGCQGIPPAPPIFATPSSLTFNGVGNFAATTPTKPTKSTRTAAGVRAEKLAKALKACKRDRENAKRKRCIASARRRYDAVKAPKPAKKARNDRRASR